MKIRKMLIIISIILFSSMQSCIISINDDSNCMKGTGSIVSEQVTVDPFNAVVNETVVDVEIVQGDSQSVIIEGHQNMIDELDLSVSHGELTVDLRGHCYKNFKLKVYITVPDLTAVTLKSTGDMKLGSFDNIQSLSVGIKSTGDLYCDGTLTIDQLLELESTSTGKIDLDVTTDEIVTYMSGTGNITLSGSCKSQYIELSSTGSYHAFDLDSEDCEVRNSGVGDVKVYVTDNLDVSISSVGSVYYMGDPVVKVNDKGVGKLIHVN